MRRIYFKTGYTLIELIISLALISVIVLGIFSISMVLNGNHQDYGQRYLVKSQTQTTLNHILNDATLAVGSATTIGSPAELDTGILIGTKMGAANNNSFCIHQQPTSGDTWVCYVFNPATYQITYCNKTYNLSDGSGYRGAGTACLASAQFLGTAYSITNPAPSFSAATGFSITIENCLNDSASSCFNAVAANQDPVNNPQVTVSGSVFPPQEGT